MRIVVPWGLIAIFFSLASFYYFSQKARIKREERRNKLNKCRKEYLDSTLTDKIDENKKVNTQPG